MSKSRVLFLCVGNSCRSQMAEAIVNARLGEQWEAFSAGSRPTGSIHPLAIQTLAEIGIDHHGRTKSVNEFRRQPFDMVVILCGEMEEECPVWLGEGMLVHYAFPDPTKVMGNQEKQIEAFRQVRDKIYEKVIALLAAYAYR